MTALGRVRRLLRGDSDSDSERLSQFVRLTDEDRRYMRTRHDERVPLPQSAVAELRGDNPRLVELREAYASFDAPVRVPSRWTDERVGAFLDLPWFRGETLITWHYRELPRINALKYFVLLRYVRDRDALGLLDRLDEDGLFGCWTYDYPGYGRVSRDLLESVNELSFLERELRLSERDGLRVLDIGAGYGRVAHRMTTALGDRVADYCCVDAIAESTFLCEYYLRFREIAPPARVVPLHEVDAKLGSASFDLAMNIHSFSECTLEAIAWWLERLAGLRIPNLLVIPNEPNQLLSLEADGTRRDFAPLVEKAGYEPAASEAALDDPAVRELVGVEDTLHLFRLRG